MCNRQNKSKGQNLLMYGEINVKKISGFLYICKTVDRMNIGFSFNNIGAPDRLIGSISDIGLAHGCLSLA